MNSTRRSIDRIAIVDPKLSDYQPLLAELEARIKSLQLFASGEHALRALDNSFAPLWIINVRLPDMPGIRLWELIRPRRRRASAFLISDVYCVDDELAARLGGATAYVCKPATPLWLEGRLPRCRSPAIRAGPLFIP